MGNPAQLYYLSTKLSLQPHCRQNRRMSLRYRGYRCIVECSPPRGAAYQRHTWSRYHLLWLLSGTLHLLPEFLIEPGRIGTPRRAKAAGGYDALPAEETLPQPGPCHPNALRAANPGGTGYRLRQGIAFANCI